MSDNRFTIGWMGVLEKPITDRGDREEAEERLYERGFGINYEGTLIYEKTKNEFLHEAFGIHFPRVRLDDRMSFARRAREIGFPVELIKPFVDLWYDGTDSNHADITLEKFLKADA